MESVLTAYKVVMEVEYIIQHYKDASALQVHFMMSLYRDVQSVVTNNSIIIIHKDASIAQQVHLSFTTEFVVPARQELTTMPPNKHVYHALLLMSSIRLLEYVCAPVRLHIKKMEDVLHVLPLGYGMELIV